MNNYKKILDKIAYSPSSLNQYDECPYAFFMNKIQMIKGDGNAYAEIGSFGHQLCENYLKDKATLEEVLIDCIENFDDHVTYEITESSKEKKYMALCEFLSGFDKEEFDKTYEILAVEKRFHWKIGKHKMVGVADLILRRKSDNKIILVDHKSSDHFLKKNGEVLKSKEDVYRKYVRQMYIYADAMKHSEDFGFFPDYIVWNHFLDEGRLTVVPFDKDVYDESIQWVLDTIKKIYKDTEFLPHMSYVMCNQLCNYRDGYCEYMLIEDEEE